MVHKVRSKCEVDFEYLNVNVIAWSGRPFITPDLADRRDYLIGLAPQTSSGNKTLLSIVVDHVILDSLDNIK